MRQYTSYCSVCTIDRDDRREMLRAVDDTGQEVVKCLHCGFVTPIRQVKENSPFGYLDMGGGYYDRDGARVKTNS